MTKQLTVISASPLGAIRLEGDDAQAFLQGQSTPDLRKLTQGDCVFGAFCNAQGRVITNGWFQRIETGFRLVISRDLVSGLIKRLRMYVLRAKVMVSDESDLSSLWLVNNAEALHTMQWMMKGPMGINLIATNADALPQDAHQLHGESFQLALIQAGIPLVSAMTTERFTPHMLSMDYLGGLSFDKGCYTGQEIVTRTQFLGKVKRTLHRFALDDSIKLETGAPLNFTSTGESVGELFSWAHLPSGGTIGLAVVRNELVSDESLEIAGHRVEVVAVAS